jgi:hypothetical protein
MHRNRWAAWPGLCKLTDFIILNTKFVLEEVTPKITPESKAELLRLLAEEKRLSRYRTRDGRHPGDMFLVNKLRSAVDRTLPPLPSALPSATRLGHLRRPLPDYNSLGLR